MNESFPHIDTSSNLFIALKDFLSKIDTTLPANKQVKFYLTGGMLVYLYTGLERSYYIEGEFSHKVYITDGMSLLYTNEKGGERQIRFNKNDSSRFNLMHPNYLQDALLMPFDHLQNMQVYGLQAVDLCVSKIARLSSIDIEDIQLLVKNGLCHPTEIQERAQAALEEYMGDLSQFKDNLSLAVHYAKSV